jgi:hypothetical protein
MQSASIGHDVAKRATIGNGRFLHRSVTAYLSAHGTTASQDNTAARNSRRTCQSMNHSWYVALKIVIATLEFDAGP